MVCLRICPLSRPRPSTPHPSPTSNPKQEYGFLGLNVWKCRRSNMKLNPITHANKRRVFTCVSSTSRIKRCYECGSWSPKHCVCDLLCQKLRPGCGQRVSISQSISLLHRAYLSLQRTLGDTPRPATGSESCLTRCQICKWTH